MRVSLILAVLALFAGCLMAQPQLAGLSFGDPGAAAFTAGGSGVNARGYRFQCNASNVTVTHLGCWHQNTNTTTRTIVLFDFSSQAVLRQVTSTAGTGWCWTALSTPLTLTNGAQYIVSSHSDGSAAQGSGAYYFKSAPGGTWQPTGTIQYLDMRYSNGSAATVFPTSILSGYQYGVPDIGYSTGPSLVCAATAGTAQSVLATDTSAAGRSIGTFTLTNNSASAGLTLNSMTITAAGTGNDSNAYSEVGIFEDTNSSTAYDAGDVRYGTAATAYPSDNGALTFTASASFAASQVRRYFVVVKLNGSTLASLGQTFNTSVTALNVTGGTGSGLPSTSMNGLVIVAPTLTVSATAGTAQSVYANDTGSGGNGISAGTFTITNGALGTADLVSITIAASGSGNDSNAYSQVALYEDTNSSSAYDAGDTLYGTAVTAFPADNGSQTFTAAQSFAVSQVRRYFVVVKLNGSTIAAPAQTFNTQVSSIAVSATSASAGTPSTVMNGLVILAPSFTIADNSSATQGTAYLGGSNFVIQQFTVSYPNGPANTLTSITVQSAGNGNDLTDYSSVALYRDANANGSYDAGTDVQVNSFAAFPSDNGAQSFTLAGAESQFTAGTTKQFFIVVAFNMTGTNNTTFATQLQAASGQSTGTTISGLPAPTSGPTAGLLLLANNLIVTFNGPGTATTVNNNDQGAGGIGRLLFDVTLQTIAAAWTVNDLTFTGTGTANHQTAYNELALYFDANSNNTYDGGDTLATAVAGVSFSAGNTYTATLSNTAFAATTTRRYFLVGKLAGTATTGQTLNAQLTGATTIPPSGGAVTTIPTASSTALIIDSPVMTAVNGAAAPAATMREGGTAFGYTAAQLAFTASNNPSTLNSLTLTTSGTGTWNVDVPTVELYLDDGNGVYDGAPTDALIFTGAGATPSIACTFTSAVNIANNQTKNIWVRLNFSATAGASVPESFGVSIAVASDMNVTGATALLGTPAPTSNLVSVVMFFVTTFSPAFDMQTGGASIVITGSGFLTPVSLTINGAVCPGTPVINAGGTQITGFKVPPGNGTNRVIVLTDGALGPKTLTQTFDYAGGSLVGNSGGGKGGGGGGCSTEESDAAWMAALGLLGIVAFVGLRRRVAR